MVLVVKNPPTNAEDVKDMGLSPCSERSPGEGISNLPQHSCLGYPMDRGAWRAAVHSVPQDRTQLKRLSTETHTIFQTLFCFIHIIPSLMFSR